MVILLFKLVVLTNSEVGYAVAFSLAKSVVLPGNLFLMTKARRRQITVPPKESLPKTLDFAKVDATCGACLLDLWDSLQSGTHADESLVAAIPHCNHLFHWTCLQTWTNQENSCPLCKKRFGTIGKYNHINGDLISKHVVQWKDFSEDEDSGGDDPLELCEKCHEPGMEFI